MMKIDRSNRTMIAFMIILLITFVLLQVFVLPCKGPDNFKWFVSVIYFFTFISFIISVNKDPGYVRKSNKISFLKLNQYFDPSYICP